MNLLQTAQQYYQKNPIQQIQGKQRELYTNALLFVIETAPFLSANEKEQMSKLIPLYPTRVIRKVKQQLIEQGIVFLQLNPNYKDSMETWLNKAHAQPNA